MKTRLVPLLAVLSLILNGCGETTAAVSSSPATAAPASPAATACAEPPAPTPVCAVYYAEHPDVPDPAALCGAVLTGQTALDGLVCYRYDLPEESFPSLRGDYAALCESLGHSPQYAFSGSQSLLVLFDTNGVLLAARDGGLLVIAGPKELLLSSMD